MIHWTKEEISILRENFKNGKEVCYRLLPNRTKHSITYKISNLKLSNGHNLWSEEEDEILIKLYPFGIKKCLPFLPRRTVAAIHSRVRELFIIGDSGTGNRKYNCNHEYFFIPNIENCYWAGFIAADGSIRQDNKTLAIKISETDLCILDKFKTIINFDGPISKEKETSSYDIKRNKIYTGQPSINIRISSKKICHDLYKNFNITTKKTLTLRPPNINDLDLCLAYIVGIIDGDGCINFQRNKKSWHPFFQFYGTESIIRWAKEKLLIALPELKVNIRQVGKVFEIRTSGKQAIAIINKLQQIPIPWRLPRKWDKFKKEQV